MIFEDLKIIYYPDPRLKKISAPVSSFDDQLKTLAAKMLELMKEHKGVGLAAPQVGENVRLFVINPSAEPGSERIYVNPVLTEAAGEDASSSIECGTRFAVMVKLLSRTR